MNGLSTNRRHWHNHRHHHHGVIDMVPDKAKVLQEVDDIQAVKNAIPVAKANLDKAADDLSVARLAAAGAQADHDAAAKALDDAGPDPPRCHELSRKQEIKNESQPETAGSLYL